MAGRDELVRARAALERVAGAAALEAALARVVGPSGVGVRDLAADRDRYRLGLSRLAAADAALDNALGWAGEGRSYFRDSDEKPWQAARREAQRVLDGG